MPLSWNEIKDRALAFSKEWETEVSEDATVDAAYGRKSFVSESSRVAFLFDPYIKLTEPLVPVEKPKRKTGRKKSTDAGTT